MAKPLVVEYQGQQIPLAIQKIDRTKLYGYIDTEVIDESGKTCELATLLNDGCSLSGKGGRALAYLSQDGLWRKKTELRPVDLHGKPITPVKSTFDTIVSLDGPERQASIDDYLSHNIRLVYQLTPEGDHSALLKELQKGTIFQFPFSYRGGVSASPGFILLGSDSNIFLCVGVPILMEFVGLKATAPTVAEEEVQAEEEDDSLDFSIM